MKNYILLTRGSRKSISLFAETMKHFEENPDDKIVFLEANEFYTGHKVLGIPVKGTQKDGK